MKKSVLLFFYFSIFCFSQTFAQQKHPGTTKEIIKTHYYTFQAQVNDERIIELEQALSKLEFITQAKVKYKPEKGMGQLMVISSNPQVIRENQKEFSPTILKKTLINLGFMPLEYSFEKKEN